MSPDAVPTVEAPTRFSRFKRIAANAFILFYAYVAFFWLLPESPLRTAMLSPVREFIANIAMDQNWQMFAPKMRKTSVYLDAQVTYDDGKKVIWHYPRVDQFPLEQRILKERYRKFGYDHVNWNKESYLWPDFAQYAARANERPGHSVQSVELIRHFQDLLSPETDFGNFAPVQSASFFTQKFDRGNPI